MASTPEIPEPEAVDGYDVIGNPIRKLAFAETSVPGLEPGYEFAAPEPLPPSHKPDGFAVAEKLAPPSPVQTIESLGIGPQTPYPTKES